MLAVAGCSGVQPRVSEGPPPPALGPEAVDTPPAPVGGLRAVQERTDYPEAARDRWIQGQVVVRAVVAPDGRVVWVAVEQSVHPLLDAAAVEAVWDSPFEPARLDGEPVQGVALVPLNYRLR